MVAKIHAIGKSVGQINSLEDLMIDQPVQSVIVDLLNDGFGKYEKCTTNITEMICQAVEECLSRSQIGKEQIDGIVFSSECAWDSDVPFVNIMDVPPHARQREALSHLLFNEFGITPCCIYTSNMHGCGNLTVTLDLCNLLITTKRCRNLLVIFADRLEPNGSRICQNNAAVYSDKAICFIMSAEADGYSLEQITTLHAAPLINRTNCDESYLRSINLADALLKCRRKFEIQTGSRINEYPAVIFENFSSEMIEFVSYSIGARKEQIYAPTKFCVAHTFSVDTLLSLEQLKENKSDFSKFALVNVGIHTFGIISINALTC